ncbi:MAG: HD domain-containing protein, partial [Thermotogae bacterium]|nr:HD domain-containing protein [Thermotogota bacterium]
ILNVAARIALTHHERWNGTGYPQGFKGTEIPWESRIVAVADSLDAMTNDRPYRKARTFDEALNEIIAHAGTLYDPEVVGALESSKTEVRKLYEDNAKMLSSMKIHLFNSMTSWTSWWKTWMKSQSKVTQDDEYLSQGG